MPRSTINFNTVRKIGLTLPGVEASTAYGSPALKVRGKLLACVPAHRSAEPGSLAVRVDPVVVNQTGVRYFCSAADGVVRYGANDLTGSCQASGTPLQ